MKEQLKVAASRRNVHTLGMAVWAAGQIKRPFSFLVASARVSGAENSCASRKASALRQTKPQAKEASQVDRFCI